MKKLYIPNKRLDAINDNVLDMMYFVKEAMNDHSNRILRIGDEIRGIMISDLTDSQKLTMSCKKIEEIRQVISEWKDTPGKIKKIADDVSNQLC